MKGFKNQVNILSISEHFFQIIPKSVQSFFMLTSIDNSLIFCIVDERFDDRQMYVKTDNASC